jgi:dTDP-L-rhamnose 4-epimerase
MRVLVTGGAGFIGSHTVDLLLERGYDVRILDLLQPRVHPKGKPPYVPAEAEFVQGDVADPRDLEGALAGIEAVFHLAAHQDYLPEFSRFVHTNTESSALLFELIVSDPQRYPVEKLVFASSQAVSGEGAYACLGCGLVFRPGPRPVERLERGEWDHRCPDCGAPAESTLIDEETCNSPHTAYGVSKYAIELLARSLGERYGIASVCMRYTYVQGPRNSFYNAYSGIARRFALRLLEGLPPICYEDGKQLRDYVNVRDVAAANVLALESDVSDGRALNVGGGRAVSVFEFARMMVEASGQDLEPLVPGEFRLGDTRHTVSDISRIRELGWKPTIAVETNVREYLEWLEGQAPSHNHLLTAERVMAQTGVVRRVD